MAHTLPQRTAVVEGIKAGLPLKEIAERNLELFSPSASPHSANTAVYRVASELVAEGVLIWEGHGRYRPAGGPPPAWTLEELLCWLAQMEGLAPIALSEQLSPHWIEKAKAAVRRAMDERDQRSKR